MTIVDSLKAKGSTGGNNIAEAIENLPMGGSGGGGNEFVITEHHDEDREVSYLDKSFSEILDAIRNGLTPVIYYDDETDETYIRRFKYSFADVEYDNTYVGEEVKYNQIRFVGHSFHFNTGDNTVSGSIIYLILLGDETVIEGSVPLDIEA